MDTQKCLQNFSVEHFYGLAWTMEKGATARQLEPDVHKWQNPFSMNSCCKENEWMILHSKLIPNPI